MFKYLTLNQEGKIGILTLKRPEMNALCNDMAEELSQMITQIENDSTIGALIITGAGEKAFMAGADIKELEVRDFVLGRKQTKQRQEVYNRIAELNIPTIAAVNGFALGAGLELALACSIRVASENVKFAAPEVNLGIIPGDGATQRLPRIIGMGRAMHMVLTGAMIDARKALEYGLVTEVYPKGECLAGAKEIAQTLLNKAPLAIAYAKEAVNKSLDVSMSVGLTMESYLHALACASEDKKEGVAAFLAKRPATFQGK